MAEYINKYANDAAIQAAVDGGELIKPYVALDENTGMIDWNTKFIDYANMPLTVKVLSDGTITLKGGFTTSYSINGGEFKTIGNGATVSINVVAGDVIIYKYRSGLYVQESINGSARHILYGNVSYYLDSSTTVSCRNTFEYSSGLVDVSNLILPATTLTTYCYENMFRNCTNLTTAPVLPATTLTSNCYYQMFSGCSKLNYIKCLATDISAFNCTYNWLKNVSPTGTFVKAAGVNWPSGDSGIPSGWTVIEE